MLKFKDDNDVCNMTTVPLWIFSQYELNTCVIKYPFTQKLSNQPVETKVYMNCNFMVFYVCYVHVDQKY
jgi:hypothetical protein